MSFLYPLFFAALAAVSAPILLHMIRRPTRNRVTFSSLQFLRTSPPRLKNRRRLENLPLLLLRCLILILLALAFARPFRPQPAPSRSVRAAKRVVVLLDTSASMRRTGLWSQAVAEARSTLADMAPADRLCLMSFDRGERKLVGFDQWAAMAPGQRAGMAGELIADLSPNWSPTHLGQALVTAVEALEDDEANTQEGPAGPRQIVLISDFQRGSALEALRAYEWPEGIELVPRQITPRTTTNASMQLMVGRDRWARPDRDKRPRVRVTNAADSTQDRFQLHWSDTEPPMDVYVPAGRSVVVRVPTAGSATAAQLRLTGDAHDFDNTLYVASQDQKPVTILYVGTADPNDPADMLFYARRAFGTDAAIPSRVVHRAPDAALMSEEVDGAHLIVVTDTLGPNADRLRRYLQSGRTILLVMKSDGAVTTFSQLADVAPPATSEAQVDEYAMLGRMDFEHPLLTAFADPQFGNFTRIHFWKHRTVDIEPYPAANVLAWFDDQSPAWFELGVGKGSLLVWTAGWHREDSDLALSSKFAPLLYSILEYGGTLAARQSQYSVGDAIALPTRTERVGKPNGSTISLDGDAPSFAETNVPGIYTAEAGSDGRDFAVNVAAPESETEPMPIESLESLGVALEPASDVTIQPTQRAEMNRSFAQMESQQKLWRWVLAAAMVLLLIEIWLGGWLTRARPTSEGDRP